jgi:hypothetical protein
VVTHEHLVRAARHLRSQFNGRAFLTVPRVQVTQLLREISGDQATRLKSRIAEELEQVLLDHGVRCFPSLVGTTTADAIRLIHAGGLLSSIIDALAHPGEATDRHLAEVITKVKGRWDWDRAAPAA